MSAFGVKRTLRRRPSMSAFNPKRTSAHRPCRFPPPWSVEELGACFRVRQRRTEARPSLIRGETGTDTLVTQALVRRRFGIAGIITINLLLPHLHEGAGS